MTLSSFNWQQPQPARQRRWTGAATWCCCCTARSCDCCCCMRSCRSRAAVRAQGVVTSAFYRRWRESWPRGQFFDVCWWAARGWQSPATTLIAALICDRVLGSLSGSHDSEELRGLRRQEARRGQHACGCALRAAGRASSYLRCLRARGGRVAGLRRERGACGSGGAGVGR